MERYERSVRVRAPFEVVWEFHSSVDGLVALTPGWMNLEIDECRGPSGEMDPEVLEPGATIRSSIRPLGVGPRQRWLSTITDRERGDGTGYFVDEMAEGPFTHWTHTHSFYEDGSETVVRDRIEYELPLGTLGSLIGPLAVVGFDPMFRYRHSRTRKLLEK